MNNCYFGLRGGAEGVECPGDDDNNRHHSLLHRQMLDGDQEERDRSLPQVEVYHDQLNHANQPMLEEEELPDVSFSSDSVPIEKSVNKPLRNEKDGRTVTATVKDMPVHSSSGISRGSASVARSASSGNRTASRTKFLSRSHNSLLPPAPPDYSKVESKVKKYIDAMKELGRQRRQAQLPSPERRQSDSIPSTAPGSPPEVQEDEKTIELRRLLAEREAKVLALQENHDRLLLDNARLQNLLDEMRAKLRVHQLKNQQKVPVRRTNSPSDLKGDPLAASTAHGSNGQQDHPSTSCLELMMLPTAVASAGDNRPGDNNTSSSFSNYSSSIGSVSDSASNGDCNSIVHRDHRREHAIHLAAPTAANEQLGYQQHRHMILENRRPLKTSERTRLLQQLKEATLAALFVRDQTRTLIHRMNRLPS